MQFKKEREREQEIRERTGKVPEDPTLESIRLRESNTYAVVGPHAIPRLKSSMGCPIFQSPYLSYC